MPHIMLEALIGQVAEWARSHIEVLGVLLVGSQARGTAGPLSDIDFVLLLSQPQGYLSDPSWASAFGDVERLATEDWGAVQSLRVLYADGREVEFGLTTLRWLAPPLDPGTRRVLQGGYRVVYDREGTLGAGMATLCQESR